MTESLPKKRRSWAERIVIAIGLLFAAGLLLLVGSCVGLFAWRQRQGAREAGLNKQRAAPLVAALERYQKTKGGCPDSLDRLTPEFIAEIPQAHRGDRDQDFHYRCAKGGHFWVAFDDSSGAFLPSDIVYEWDSERREWWTGDISAAGFMKQE